MVMGKIVRRKSPESVPQSRDSTIACSACLALVLEMARKNAIRPRVQGMLTRIGRKVIPACATITVENPALALWLMAVQKSLPQCESVLLKSSCDT